MNQIIKKYLSARLSYLLHAQAGGAYVFSVLLCIVFTSSLSAQAPLSLDAYKQKVLDYNQDVKMAGETVKAAKAAVKESRTAYFPGVQGSAGYNYNFNPATLSVQTLQATMERGNWSAGGELNQSVYAGGAIGAAYQASKLQSDIAVLSEELSVDNIAYTAELAYWNALASMDIMNVSKRYLDIVKYLEEVVKTRFNDGLISKNDLLKIETNLKDATYQVSKTEQSFTNNCILLNVLMGAQAENPLSFSDSLQSVVWEYAFLSLEDVLSRRPDYLIASKQIDWQKEQSRLDRSQFLPKLGVGASANYGTLLLNFNGNTQWSPVLFAKLSVPIFLGGKSKHTGDRNRALIRSKEYLQAAASDQIERELNTAVNNVSRTRAQIEIARENLEVAKESLELHMFSYEEGRVSILDVQSAQISWLQAYVNVIEAYLNNKLAVANYRKVISE